ncbi:unnamed protein product [Linum trigynum]|uniref:Chitin-binding type-1 domain-containing protein n=1 Tax=Linum trigynum TaxID=586398 RepID=A0AAV2EP45_9ROSI
MKINMNMALPLLIIAALILLATNPAAFVANAQDCGPGKKCKDGGCCSEFGWCGNTDKHCGEGCLSNCDGDKKSPPPPDKGNSFAAFRRGGVTVKGGDDDGSYNDPHCGSQGGGATCDPGYCCSPFGFCGTTVDYCGDGCQNGCQGGGHSPPSPRRE